MKPEPSTNLEPLSYHRELTDYFQTHHPAVWKSFHAAQQSQSQREDVELSLLKSTYRLSESDHPDLYADLARAREVLGVEQPIALYQADQHRPHNAFMSYTPEQGHLVFEGKILAALEPEEVAALIGHETGHYRLWAQGDGEFLTTSQILRTMVAERDVHASIVESERLYRLYTEIFCDRAGALAAEGKPDPMITTLTRIHTGEVQVSAEDYLRQAEEIFAKSADETSRGTTHPEHFVRARAVAAWAANPADPAGADALVRSMLEGATPLDQLDVLGRARLTQWTDETLHHLDRLVDNPTEGWTRHRACFAPHEAEARRVVDRPDPKALAEALPAQHETVRDYFVYLLLDFAAIDPSADRTCRKVAAALGLEDRFVEVSRLEGLSLAA